jgi:hypothetical protein
MSRRRRTKGAELIEFTFTFIPFLAMMIFIVNTGWAVFGQASMQQAVRLAVRTGITMTGTQTTDLTGSVKALVIANSKGFLNGEGQIIPPATAPAFNYIKVHYFDGVTSADVSGQADGDKGGNIMQVSVEGYPLSPLLSRIYTLQGSVDHNASNIYVYAADVIEPSNSRPSIGSAP